MDTIVAPQRIVVRQVKEWTEILAGFETRNRFDILDEQGALLGRAAEEAGGLGRMFARNFLGSARACRIHVYDAEGREGLLGVKPFRWFFHRMDVFENGTLLGAIQRKWSVLHRRFVVENPHGQEVLEIVSPLFRIWTYKVIYQGKEVARISKSWGGFLRETFSDADTFALDFGADPVPLPMRKILLVATLLIDLSQFENNNGN